MVNQSIEKLHQMRLNTMASVFSEQLNTPATGDLSFEERFAMIVDQEWTFRENRKLERRLKSAKLRHQAAIEDIDFRHPRKLDKSVVLSLAECRWITNHQNIIITGPTGIGKSYIAEAFANKACRQGYTAVCYRSPRLFKELELARGDGSYMKVLKKLAKTDVLVVDDWGLSTLTEPERRDFLEIMEDRHGLRSTIMTSQYPVKKWFNLIGESTMADAIMDRIVHNAHKIPLQGDSLRKKRSKLTKREHPK